MIIEIVGKFYDNHSLTIINRNLAIMLAKCKPDWDIYITPLDQVDPTANLNKTTIKDIKEFYHIYLPWGRIPPGLSKDTLLIRKELKKIAKS